MSLYRSLPGFLEDKEKTLKSCQFESEMHPKSHMKCLEISDGQI